MKKLSILATLFICMSWTYPDQGLRWVNDTYANMTVDERIGQLIYIRAHSDLGADHVQTVKNQIRKYHVGGLCFFQGTPEKQAKLTNEYQALSKVPLMVTMDAEWGLGMRFKDDGMSFPKAMVLGAIKDDALIEEMGIEIGKQLRALGVHVNFAPVVDVNNNPNNPVINYRSFGEDKENVAAKGLAYMRGMQKSHVMACAKHFPGHGDTDVDSHYDLPIIQHSRHRLDSLELYPFKVLSKYGIGSMMVAHLQIPAFDKRENRPTTLSVKTVDGLLRNYLGFDGIIFTDALEMKGVAKHFPPGKMEVEALKAGNDVLLLPIDISTAINAIKAALDDGSLKWETIEKSVKKVLLAKYKLGIHKTPSKINFTELKKTVTSKSAEALKYKLYEHALTLVKNENHFVPLFDTQQRLASISFGASKKTVFQKQLDKYGVFKHYQFNDQSNPNKFNEFLVNLKSYDKVIVSIHDMSEYASKKFGIESKTVKAISQILKTNNQIQLCVFGSPYSIGQFKDVPSLLVAYTDEDIAQKMAAQGIMGAFSFKGALPVSVGSDFISGDGILSSSLLRLSYGIPEQVGMNRDSLLKIDTIIQEMISKKAAPGCEVLVAKEGKIVYHKNFGYHTYNKKKEVQLNSIYDMASVTKIMSSTLSLMKLEDQGRLKTENRIVDYLPEVDTFNKADLVINDILAHHAGLAGWIPFYRETQSEGKKPKNLKEFYRTVQSDSFNLEVTDDLYLRSDYKDSVYYMIYNNDLKANRKYRYSDLGFYMFHQIIERQSGLTLDDFTTRSFYNPLGLQRTLFNPLRRFDKSLILPTEKDNYFRNQVVHGYVHDMGAAMIGGVSGHAGLFSTANDMAILSQMLLNGGYYGGVQFLRPSTIKKFTTRHPKSLRRGLGFDMKQLEEGKTLNMSESASPSTYGHLGFTGTCVWIDPDHDLIYIFLSNRTYPSMNNKAFNRGDYRPRVQTAVYSSFLSK